MGMNIPQGVESNSLAPLKFFITAIFSFVVLNILIIINTNQGNFNLSYLRNFPVLTMVHLAALGWIVMVIIGAMHQLVPVVLEVPLKSQKLAETTFYIYFVGVIGFVINLFKTNFDFPLIIFASLIFLALILFLINIFLTFLKVEKINLIMWYLIFTLVYFFITICFGLLLVFNLHWGFFDLNPDNLIKAHSHLAVLGFITLIIMGVSYKLIPMFALSSGYKETKGKLSLILLNIGIWLLFFGFLLEKKLLQFSATLILFLAIIFYLLQILEITQKRFRKFYEVNLLYSFSACFSLLILASGALFYVFLKIPKNFNLYYGYAYLGFMGWISFFIIGQLHKIVPFLVWLNKYSEKVGLEKVPLMKDMVSEKLEKIEFYFINIGVYLTFSGFIFAFNFLIIVGSTFCLLGTLIFTYNMLTVLKK